VENLDTLLADMETFHFVSDGKEKSSGRKIKIEVEPKDELEKKLDNLTEKLVDAFDQKSELNWKDDAKTVALGSCTKCMVDISDSAVLAGTFTFHPECFTCTHCGDRLGAKYYCVDNGYYCDTHKEVPLPKCVVCGDSISTTTVTVSGTTYHPHCFTCVQCGVAIHGKFYTTQGDKFLCELDYKQTRDKCSHCGLPILERILTALDQKYHPSCFRCSLCDTGLDGVPFLKSGSSVNCQSCYTKYKAAPCARCGTGIVSTGDKKTTLITCNGQSFHQECYTCQDCATNLCGEYVCCDQDQIICFTCDVKRRK